MMYVCTVVGRTFLRGVVTVPVANGYSLSVASRRTEISVMAWSAQQVHSMSESNLHCANKHTEQYRKIYSTLWISQYTSTHDL